MAYVLFATSALMVAFGVYSLVTGYPVVQVEEGWTAVISGSTFIAGGVVTAALGLVLRVLGQIRTGLVGLRNAPAIEPAAVEAAALVQAPIAEAPAELPPPPAVPAFALEPAAVHEPAAMPEPVDVMPPAPPPPPLVADIRLEDLQKPSPAEGGWLQRTLKRQQSSATPIHDPGPPPPEAEPEPEPKHEPVAAEAGEPSPMLREAPVSPPPELPPAPPPVAPPLPEPELEAPPVAPDLEPDLAHEDLEEAPPVASAKVIGRYEADGTSYVMYADGSIEAQTESGVYRFASMAELKSFIET